MNQTLSIFMYLIKGKKMDIKKLTVLLLLLSGIQQVMGAELYVRPDGGSWQQCNGTANKAYSSDVTGNNCAVRHIFELLDPQNKVVRMSGGDTVNIMNNVDGTAAEYTMGSHGDYTRDDCDSAWAYQCSMPSIPSGTALNPTRIRGGNTDSCAVKPMLWGTARAGHIININNAEHIEVSCLTITDKSSCIDATGYPDKSLICDRSTPYDKPFADTGILMRDSKEILLKDLNVQGLSKGIHAGRLNNVTLDNVNIHANSMVGWDGDISYMGGDGSANTGTITFINSSITFNGCGLIYNPGGSNHEEPHACARQDIGGYGDGVGTGATGGDWVFENVKVLHNNSDGIDLLYHTLGGKVTIKNSHIEGNAGNQVKVSGNSEITNNIIIGNCGWNSRQEAELGGNGENCRALGTALSFSYTHSDTQIDVINNTILSEGDCILSGDNRTGVADGTQSLNVINNVFYALVDWHQSNAENSCMYYTEHPFPIRRIHNNIIHKSKAYANPCVNFQSNVPDGAIGSTCTTSSAPYFDHDDHSVASNPQLTDINLGIKYSSYDIETLTNEMNKPFPLSEASPLVDAGYDGSIAGISIPSTDHFGDVRIGKPDIGAIEYKVRPKAPVIINVIKINQ
jgi:hypothetical protein